MSESMWKAAAQQCRKDRQALYERIAALEAELGRLKPSGQVAEDATAVRCYMDVRTDQEHDDGVQALFRLAAKAQGYEAAVANNAALEAWIDKYGHATWCERRGDKRKCVDGCAAKEILEADHTGAALLEKHREELAASARRHETTRATMHVREEQHRKEVEAFTARLAALREHAQMLYECAPSTNSRTSREQVEQWEKAKRTHHEVMGEPDAGAELLTELNDHRRNIQVLRDELGAKDDEHVVDAFSRWKERLATAEAAVAALPVPKASDISERTVDDYADELHRSNGKGLRHGQQLNLLRYARQAENRAREMASRMQTARTEGNATLRKQIEELTATVSMYRESIEALLGTLPRIVFVREGAGHEDLLATLAVSVSAAQRDVQKTMDRVAATGADAAAAWDEANGGITPATALRGVAIANAIRALVKTGPKP